MEGFKELAGKKLSEEEYAALMEKRKEVSYLMNALEGRDYAIPKDVGLRKIIIDEEIMGAEDITVGYAEYEPGEYHEPHAHKDAEEFMYVISGKVVGILGDVASIQQPGDVMFFPRGVRHGFYNPFGERMTHIFGYTRSSLSKAGYSLESEGYKEIGDDVEKAQ